MVYLAAVARKFAIPISLFTLALIILTTRFHNRNDYVPYRSSETNSHTLVPQISCYGPSRCLPPITDELIRETTAWNTSCRQYSPFPHLPGGPSLATITVSYGEQKDYIQRALRTLMLHSMIHRDDMHIMCQSMVDDMWNKEAFLLKILFDQMLLPQADRYDWLFWVDRDAIVIDQCRSSSTFLPPESRQDTKGRRIHLVAARDGNGLNAGVFFLRVNQWSIRLLENVLAYRFYNPKEELRFTEQSAMAKVLESPEFSSHIEYVPWEWFNAYPNSEFGPTAFRDRKDEEGLDYFQARRGDFLLHFAGPWEKEEPMKEWLEVIERMENVWKDGSAQRDVSKAVKNFWEGEGYHY